ncbi:hypothetical protein [Streptomyces armeniacus]|uniref:hypothetical protein n=1 Tax=Streptomyces armeniacus TaxID=83291 RepID=UPI001AD82DC0|nr:hypothetical protein [Streptomyces armeniacus]
MTSVTTHTGNWAHGGGNHASNNTNSTLLQAGRDINLHQQEPLPTESVPQEELNAVRHAWVAEDEEGKQITTAPEALAKLDRGEHVVVIVGPPGTGKCAAGLRALSELRPVLPGDGGPRLRLRLEHVLPDWESVEKDKFLLPAEPGRGYLLDVSGESGRWGEPELAAKKFLSPHTSWRALRLMRRARKHATPPRRLSFDVAWRQSRVRRHPGEAHYLLHGHDGNPDHTKMPSFTQDPDGGKRRP